MLNKKSPTFKLPATGNTTIDSQKLLGQAFVLYFYPKDDTPGCSQEGADFTKLHSQFKKHGVEIFGVSKDSLSSHEKFKAKKKYSFELISDTKGELCKAFDVLKTKSMFGKTYQGIERSTFFISSKGKILKEWRKVKVKDHAKKVLDFIKTKLNKKD
ncbi:MAG: peroxiredoxin [Bdellovibrionales bacterium]|nr:peroxiredoxin [Bdellovibrionales bacterium]